MSDQSYQYDIAISFAGEDRKVAEVIKTFIAPFGVSVFYDNDERENLWGKSLTEELIDIYRNKARYCLMLVSENYLKKIWTNHERKAAITRAVKSDSEYILPYILDDTGIEDVRGIHSDTAYIRRSDVELLDLSTIVLNKLYPGQDFSVQPGKLIHLVDACDFILSFLQNPKNDSSFDPYMTIILDSYKSLIGKSSESFNVGYYLDLGAKMLAEANIIKILEGKMLGDFLSLTDHGYKWSKGIQAGERHRFVAEFIRGEAFIG